MVFDARGAITDCGEVDQHTRRGQYKVTKIALSLLQKSVHALESERRLPEHCDTFAALEPNGGAGRGEIPYNAAEDSVSLL
jgi:hypothetical protein